MNDPFPDVHREAVELLNEITDQHFSAKLYIEHSYSDTGAHGMTQILVEGAADDGLIGVAQLARKKGHRVDVENGGLLINVLGRHRWQSHD